MDVEAGFAAFHIPETWLDLLRRMDIEQPTPVQAESIPHIQAGRDLIAESQTGSGKTLAYLLPVLRQTEPELKQLQAMIIVPTRELAMQILNEIERFQQVSGVLGQALIGGAALNRQIERLKQHPQIVVGTPGRLLELIKTKKLKMNEVRTIVVDEVDHVLEAGSAGEVEQIFHSALRNRQILLFSATIPESIHSLSDRWMRQPVRISVDSSGRPPAQIEHSYYVCEERDKVDMLRRLIRAFQPRSALIFVNEIENIGELAAKLNYVGLTVEALYGDSGKQDRAVVLQRFRTGKTKLLIATDVAARGLDIAGLTHVFHYDPATDADHYLHRSGRTGRMGREGWAISIVTPRQQFIMDKFAKVLGIQIIGKSLFKGKAVESDLSEKEPHRTARGKNRQTVSAPDAALRTAPASASALGSKAKQSPIAKSSNKKMKAKNRKDKGAPKWLKEKRDGGKPMK